MSRYIALVFLLCAWVAQAAEIRFNRDIRPILSDKCFVCHGPDAKNKNIPLRLDSPEAIAKPIASGQLLTRITSANKALRMPPAHTGQTLTEREIEVLKQWVAQGAPWEKHWAYLRAERPAAPEVSNKKWIRNPIDAFVLARLDREKLAPSAEASRETLLRRASLDLTGLPPTIAELDSNETYEQALDRMLASPRYAERMAARWLDAARYADSNGYQSDGERDMYRWRDWVLDAFRRNMPFDQFTIEQLAGDLLPNATLSQRIATGFHRNHRGNGEGGIVPEEYLVEFSADRVETTSTVWLGSTIGCARCHNHKYDPISQRDYYSLGAIFATGYNPDHWKPPQERFLPDVPKAEQEEITKHNAEIDVSLNKLTKELDALRKPYERKLFDQRLAAAGPEFLRADVREAFALAAPKRNEIQKYLVTKFTPVLKVTPDQVDEALPPDELETSKKTAEKIQALKAFKRSYGKIQALWALGQPAPIRLLRRGAYETPGEVVQPGFLEILSPEGRFKAQKDDRAQGDAIGYRLALARWTASPENPLTARVFVNRVWMLHVGKGLVDTPENFGRMGSAPTNQELLDWLAVDFMNNGWKMKRLHKQIMISSAYRQYSQRPADGVASKAEEIDSGNDLLWRMNLRRADAEAIRDSILAVSGKLSPAFGGAPVPLDATKDGLITASEKGKGENADQQFRRSTYLLVRRNYSTSFLDVFDFPVMAANCTRRGSSATPLQSLTLLNGDFAMKRAEDFASRVGEFAGPAASPEEKVETAFRLALARKPQPQETQWTLGHLQKIERAHLQMNAKPDDAARQALTGVCQMILATNEFLYID